MRLIICLKKVRAYRKQTWNQHDCKQWLVFQPVESDLIQHESKNFLSYQLAGHCQTVKLSKTKLYKCKQEALGPVDMAWDENTKEHCFYPSSPNAYSYSSCFLFGSLWSYRVIPVVVDITLSSKWNSPICRLEGPNYLNMTIWVKVPHRNNTPTASYILYLAYPTPYALRHAVFSRVRWYSN